MIVTVPATVAQDRRSTWADGNAVASAVEDEQCSVRSVYGTRPRPGARSGQVWRKKKSMVKKPGEAGIEVRSWAESEGRSKVRQTRPTSFRVKTPGKVRALSTDAP